MEQSETLCSVVVAKYLHVSFSDFYKEKAKLHWTYSDIAHWILLS